VSSKEPITAETLKARAALAGVKLDEEKLDDLAFTMEQSLAAVRALDLRALRLVEPAVTFSAAWSE
jgi:hypothetical protein